MGERVLNPLYHSFDNKNKAIEEALAYLKYSETDIDNGELWVTKIAEGEWRVQEMKPPSTQETYQLERMVNIFRLYPPAKNNTAKQVKG